MLALIEANWPLFLLALVIGILVAWFIFRATRRTRVEPIAEDVLDEGASPAARNQALIDAPPVSADPPQAPPAEPAAPVAAATTASPADKTIGDDLTRIKGVGPKLRALLGEHGVVSFNQIAAWSQADIDRIDPLLGKFSGRIERDDWVTQAELLQSGDMDAYKAKFGNIA